MNTKKMYITRAIFIKHNSMKVNSRFYCTKINIEAYIHASSYVK